MKSVRKESNSVQDTKTRFTFFWSNSVRKKRFINVEKKNILSFSRISMSSLMFFKTFLLCPKKGVTPSLNIMFCASGRQILFKKFANSVRFSVIIKKTGIIMSYFSISIIFHKQILKMLIKYIHIEESIGFQKIILVF